MPSDGLTHLLRLHPLICSLWGSVKLSTSPLPSVGNLWPSWKSLRRPGRFCLLTHLPPQALQLCSCLLGHFPLDLPSNLSFKPTVSARDVAHNMIQNSVLHLGHRKPRVCKLWTPLQEDFPPALSLSHRSSGCPTLHYV